MKFIEGSINTEKKNQDFFCERYRRAYLNHPIMNHDPPDEWEIKLPVPNK